MKADRAHFEFVEDEEVSEDPQVEIWQTHGKARKLLVTVPGLLLPGDVKQVQDLYSRAYDAGFQMGRRSRDKRTDG